MTDSPTVANRYECCEHCIDIKEGCPRLDGHPTPCPIADCSTHLTGTEHDITQWNETQRIDKMRDDLIDNVVTIVGYEPPGLRVLLRTLSHPEVVNEAKLYFETMDIANRCSKYEPPWSCAREAEAQYENIQYGWLGAVNGIGYDESWCEPCRRKVLGT